ncbi:MAG: amino acid kinase [Thiogranum sp.]
MWVVKIGGSLAADELLPCWLDSLSCYGGGEVVIVPGGGPFAEQVRISQRCWRIDDSAVHVMALLAMEQYGFMMSGIRNDLVPVECETDMLRVLKKAGVPIWLPTFMVSKEEDIEHSWDVTSDSLAAWLAWKIGASRLLLVKSVKLGDSKVTAEELSQQGIVDVAFPDYLRQGKFITMIVQQEHYKLIPQLLNGTTAGAQVVANGTEKLVVRSP